ncbi:MAG: site-2 protease family protein [Thaumarchaeota archaeon]|nr:site-2 protease family protein [Candidatus Calditenuaceae archaeon]MDW8187007.1 site-2 protease family protein [Nitrososphaerota archaeon]
MHEEEVKKLTEAVSRHFTVVDARYEGGVLTYRVREEEVKRPFKALFKDVWREGYVPTAERDELGIRIRFFRASQISSKRSPLPILLLTFTIITTFVDGQFRSTDVARFFGPPFDSVVFNAIVYTVALLAIIGIHEMGHKLSAKIDGIETSLPHFIPGIPGSIPTFGAVIFQRSPVVNKDDLFDLGVSGPIAGFLVALVVTAYSFLSASWVPIEEILQLAQEGRVGTLRAPLIFEFFAAAFRQRGEGLVPVFPTVVFAAWLGMVVTSLNLLPIWQLDGGRIFRSFLSKRGHTIASYISIAFLIMTGYLLFAILLLLLMRNPVDVTVLDNVSKLSTGRKIAVAGVFGMLALTFVIIQPLFPVR